MEPKITYELTVRVADEPVYHTDTFSPESLEMHLGIAENVALKKVDALLTEFATPIYYEEFPND